LLAALAQFFNFSYALVEHCYFLPDEIITRNLPLDRVLEVLISQENEAACHDQNANKGYKKPLFAFLAKLIPPGEKVNPRHQSKLLSAKPQAIIRDGASLARAPALTLLLKAISANGLATSVWVPIFC